MSIARRLLTPIDYLRIKQGIKYKYDFYIPIILSTVVVIIYYMIPIKSNEPCSGGVFESISNVLSVLIGFYIASLAAIATFKSERLNETMKGGDPARLETKYGTERLTRRRFLCLLFSYLVILCFVLIILGIASETLIRNTLYIAPKLFVYFKFLYIYVYTFLLSQLVIVTLLGLSYVADKMHDKIYENTETSEPVDPDDVHFDDDYNPR